MTAEKTFNLRFTLSAEIPGRLLEDDDFDEKAWIQEWEAQIKPRLIRLLFAEVRSTPSWEARIRNRGISPEDEIEVVVTRTFAPLPEPTLQ